jgi:hypothetical protein
MFVTVRAGIQADLNMSVLYPESVLYPDQGDSDIDTDTHLAGIRVRDELLQKCNDTLCVSPSVFHTSDLPSRLCPRDISKEL